LGLRQKHFYLGGNGQEVKILIVDDEAELVDSCARILSRAGLACVKAFDGAEAIDLIDAERPDLVVTDLHLPLRDGFQVARYAREHYPFMGVIIITAYHTEETARDAYAAGAAGYLRKPFSSAELTDAVTQLLGAPNAR
jgi:DNA-binding response OmpR family regulator